MKKITLVIDSFRDGGAERVCANYLEILVESGFDVSVWTYNPGNTSIISSNILPLVKIIDFNSKNGVDALPKMHKAFSASQDTIYIAFNHQIALLLLICKTFRFFNKGNIIIARNINFLSKEKKKLKGWKGSVTKLLMNTVYNKCDFFISQCDEMKKDMVSNFRIEENRICVIYNPISKKMNQNDIPSIKDIDIIFVGRLAPQKGIYNLLKILKLIMEQRNVSICLVGDGILKDEITEFYKQSKVYFPDSKIDWIPSTSHIETLYKRSKVLVLTSEYEGFPNVLIESISCGTPVVSFDCLSGPSEIIKDEMNGFLIAENDFDIFTEKVIYLLDNKLTPVNRDEIVNTKYKLTEFITSVIKI